MSDFFPLLIALIISIALSTSTVFALHRPLRKLLEAACSLGTTVDFWTRAAVTVIYLLPLWVVLVFGMPDLERANYVHPGEIARRSLASASFALVAIIVATGLRLSGRLTPGRS
jgi:hypothetical protein